MSDDEKSVPSVRLFDRRIVERNIKKGIVGRKDYDKFLKALPDAAVKICPPEERAFDAAGSDDDLRDDDDQVS